MEFRCARQASAGFSATSEFAGFIVTGLPGAGKTYLIRKLMGCGGLPAGAHHLIAGILRDQALQADRATWLQLRQRLRETLSGHWTEESWPQPARGAFAHPVGPRGLRLLERLTADVTRAAVLSAVMDARAEGIRCIVIEALPPMARWLASDLLASVIRVQVPEEERIRRLAIRETVAVGDAANAAKIQRIAFQPDLGYLRLVAEVSGESSDPSAAFLGAVPCRGCRS